MKLTAWKINGPAYTWEEVEAWTVSGSRLTIRRNLGRRTVEEVRLPADIIGFTDDTPVRLAGETRSTTSQPDPERASRQGPGPHPTRRPRIVDRFDSDADQLLASLPAHLRDHRGAAPKKRRDGR